MKIDVHKQKIKERDCIYFLHIPKTAGTTFYSLLQKRFRKNEILILPDRKINRFFESTYPDEFSNIRFARQHSDYRFFRFIPRKVLFLTILRNPITRMVSLYNHILRVETHAYHDHFINSNISLLEFVESEEFKDNNNEMVKDLVGRGLHLHQLPDSDLLSIAKYRLFEFAFFGIQERFEESLVFSNLLLVGKNWNINH